jgi:hypothetical protein
MSDNTTEQEEALEFRGVKDDIIFREAERFGFDIRNADNTATNKRSFSLFSENEPTTSSGGKVISEAVRDGDDIVLNISFNFQDIAEKSKKFSRTR